jgi:hypothetical protein
MVSNSQGFPDFDISTESFSPAHKQPDLAMTATH